MGQAELEALMALDPMLAVINGELYRLSVEETPQFCCNVCCFDRDACGPQHSPPICSLHAQRIGLPTIDARYTEL